MATYTVTGHPLNYADLGVAMTDAIRTVLRTTAWPQSVTIVLSGPDDTKVKGHNVLR
jgi:hypothetical protein